MFLQGHELNVLHLDLASFIVIPSSYVYLYNVVISYHYVDAVPIIH